MSELPDWSVYDKKMDGGVNTMWRNPAPDAAVGTPPFQTHTMIVGPPNQFPYGPLPNQILDPKIINEQFKKAMENMKIDDPVNNPKHYGGADNPYEAIKVIEAWGLNFNLGNTAKYISRAGKKDAVLQDLKKARWYLDREIQNLENKPIG